MRTSHLLASTALTAAALFAMTPAATAASTSGLDVSAMTLSVSYGETDSLVPDESAILACNPALGTHPSPTRACRSLARANGDIARLAPKDGYACTLDYQPRSVSVKGTYRGKELDWQGRFPNTCTMLAETGDLFTFAGGPALPLP
ncbi:SSI family serine proteinase inhibitor [Crossiella sp. CA198]|uniref:SSI family serine proteinase inhibitor n=1 Tax=Crossiella sp. CA198 TaxID=3455607 RepID=UPI003F8D53E5